MMGSRDCLEMRKDFCLLASLQRDSSQSEKVSPAQPFSYSSQPCSEDDLTGLITPSWLPGTASGAITVNSTYIAKYIEQKGSPSQPGVLKAIDLSEPAVIIAGECGFVVCDVGQMFQMIALV